MLEAVTVAEDDRAVVDPPAIDECAVGRAIVERDKGVPRVTQGGRDARMDSGSERRRERVVCARRAAEDERAVERDDEGAGARLWSTREDARALS